MVAALTREAVEAEIRWVEVDCPNWMTAWGSFVEGAFGFAAEWRPSRYLRPIPRYPRLAL